MDAPLPLETADHTRFMQCLLCHEKIPRLRAWTTKSEFCCDEHAAKYKKQTLERLLTEQDAAPGAQANLSGVHPSLRTPPPLPAVETIEAEPLFGAGPLETVFSSLAAEKHEADSDQSKHPGRLATASEASEENAGHSPEQALKSLGISAAETEPEWGDPERALEELWQATAGLETLPPDSGTDEAGLSDSAELYNLTGPAAHQDIPLDRFDRAPLEMPLLSTDAPAGLPPLDEPAALANPEVDTQSAEDALAALRQIASQARAEPTHDETAAALDEADPPRPEHDRDEQAIDSLLDHLREGRTSFPSIEEDELFFGSAAKTPLSESKAEVQERPETDEPQSEPAEEINLAALAELTAPASNEPDQADPAFSQTDGDRVEQPLESALHSVDSKEPALTDVTEFEPLLPSESAEETTNPDADAQWSDEPVSDSIANVVSFPVEPAQVETAAEEVVAVDLAPEPVETVETEEIVASVVPPEPASKRSSRSRKGASKPDKKEQPNLPTAAALVDAESSKSLRYKPGFKMLGVQPMVRQAEDAEIDLEMTSGQAKTHASRTSSPSSGLEGLWSAVIQPTEEPLIALKMATIDSDKFDLKLQVESFIPPVTRDRSRPQSTVAGFEFATALDSALSRAASGGLKRLSPSPSLPEWCGDDSDSLWGGEEWRTNFGLAGDMEKRVNPS